jgi:hypothetical protein
MLSIREISADIQKTQVEREEAVKRILADTQR